MEQTEDTNIKTIKVKIINTRWIQSAVPDEMLGIVLMRDESGNPYAQARTCLRSATEDANVTLISNTGARIYPTDANVIQAFLQNKTDTEVMNIATEIPSTVNFYRWIQWVLELMNQPEEYGPQLLMDPNWERCFQDEMSPHAALHEAHSAGVVIEKGDRWHVRDEEENAAAIKKMSEGILDKLAADNPVIENAQIRDTPDESAI